jgi:hypothetical protein
VCTAPRSAIPSPRRAGIDEGDRVKLADKPLVAVVALAACALSTTGCARQPAQPGASRGSAWSFAVSGDSRNCGNMVMPAIAAAARKENDAFYWHLGDLRAIYKVDEDYARELRFEAFLPPPSLSDYAYTAWTDFTQHQVQPFGDLPFYLGIGNHELIAPKTRTQFLIEFQPLLDRPELKAQRKADAALLKDLGLPDAPQTFFHWRQRGVEFVNLDNAGDDTFDALQVAWFDAVVAAAERDPKITTIVVGMHESLPYSKSDGHSMCSTVSGRVSGVHVYQRLAAANKSRHVYVLSSHSHFYLANAYDVPHWRDPANGGTVLPGWVVGTAGAERYPLPDDVPPGADAREHEYGYLRGTVKAGGAIDFVFHPLGDGELQAARSSDYTEADVAFCFAANPPPDKLRLRKHAPVTCEEAMMR